MAKPASYSQAREQAGLPTRASTEELSQMGVITFLSAEHATARNPETGEPGEGMLVVTQDSEGRKFQTFVGGKALVRDLNEIELPFSARIVKRGRSWTFSD